MEPDAVVEQDAVTSLITSALQPEQISHLQKVVVADPMLASIMDTLLTRASEFSGTGAVDRPETSGRDPVPARLEDGEFVFSAKAVEVIGPEVLQKLMEEAEAEATATPQKAAMGSASSPMPSLLEKDV